MLFIAEIELSEILEEISSICPNKATGFDGVPPKIIKWAPHLFAPILQVLFNKCIDLGHYPDQMKVAKVSPIHKSGDKNNVYFYVPQYSK